MANYNHLAKPNSVIWQTSCCSFQQTLRNTSSKDDFWRLKDCSTKKKQSASDALRTKLTFAILTKETRLCNKDRHMLRTTTHSLCKSYPLYAKINTSNEWHTLTIRARSSVKHRKPLTISSDEPNQRDAISLERLLQVHILHDTHTSFIIPFLYLQFQFRANIVQQQQHIHILSNQQPLIVGIFLF